jgi:hypothetical protein
MLRTSSCNSFLTTCALSHYFPYWLTLVTYAHIASLVALHGVHLLLLRAKSSYLKSSPQRRSFECCFDFKARWLSDLVFLSLVRLFVPSNAFPGCLSSWGVTFCPRHDVGRTYELFPLRGWKDAPERPLGPQWAIYGSETGRLIRSVC